MDGPSASSWSRSAPAPDQRVALGYAVLFPVSVIAKVFLAPLMIRRVNIS